MWWILQFAIYNGSERRYVSSGIQECHGLWDECHSLDQELSLTWRGSTRNCIFRYCNIYITYAFYILYICAFCVKYLLRFQSSVSNINTIIGILNFVGFYTWKISNRTNKLRSCSCEYLSPLAVCVTSPVGQGNSYADVSWVYECIFS